MQTAIRWTSSLGYARDRDQSAGADVLILISWHKKVVKTISLVLVLRICGNLKSWQNNGYVDVSTSVVTSQTSSLGYARDRDQSAGACQNTGPGYARDGDPDGCRVPAAASGTHETEPSSVQGVE